MRVLVDRHYANASSSSSVVGPCASFEDGTPKEELCRAVDFCHRLRRTEEDGSAPDLTGRSVDMALVCEALERSIAGVEGSPGRGDRGGSPGGEGEEGEGHSRLVCLIK